MSSPGLATMTRGQFLDLKHITDEMKEALKAQRKTTRSIFEQSTATTQCRNTIGPCVLGTDCYLCGAPIYLNTDGSKWTEIQLTDYIKSGSEGNRDKWIEDAEKGLPKKIHQGKSIDKKILPQCEHILPVMQAFLILGGLYWTKTFEDLTPEEQEQLKKIEYAWSHAHCNLIKSDKNLFTEGGGGGGGGGAAGAGAAGAGADVASLDIEMVDRLLKQVWKEVPSIKSAVASDKKQWMNEREAAIATKIQPLVEKYQEIYANPLLFFASVLAPVYHMDILLPEHNPGIAAALKISGTAPAAAPPEAVRGRLVKRDVQARSMLAQSTKAADLSLASGSLLGGDILIEMFKTRENLKKCGTWLNNLFDLGLPVGDGRELQKYIVAVKNAENVPIDEALQALYIHLLPHQENDREMIQEFIATKMKRGSVADQQKYMTHLWQAIVLVNFLRKNNHWKAGGADCTQLQGYEEAKETILKEVLASLLADKLISPNTTLSLLTKNWNVSEEGEDEVVTANLTIVEKARDGGALPGKEEGESFDEWVGAKNARATWSRVGKRVLAAVRIKRSPLVKIETYARIINTMRREESEIEGKGKREQRQGDSGRAKRRKIVDGPNPGGRANTVVREIEDIAEGQRERLQNLACHSGACAEKGGLIIFQSPKEMAKAQVHEDRRRQQQQLLAIVARMSLSRSPGGAEPNALAAAAPGGAAAASSDSAEPNALSTLAAAAAAAALLPLNNGGGGRKGLSKSGKKPKKNHQRKKTRKKHRQKRTRKTKKMPKKKTVKLIHFYNNRNKQNKSKKK